MRGPSRAGGHRLAGVEAAIGLCGVFAGLRSRPAAAVASNARLLNPTPVLRVAVLLAWASELPRWWVFPNKEACVSHRYHFRRGSPTQTPQMARWTRPGVRSFTDADGVDWVAIPEMVTKIRAKEDGR